MLENSSNKLWKFVRLLKSLACRKVIRNTKPHIENFKHIHRKSWFDATSIESLSNILFLMIGGYVIGSYLEISKKVSNLALAKTFSNALSGRRERYNFIADVVDTAAPAVVYIEVQDSRRLNLGTSRPVSISNGSGFIVESDGLILTNAHVVIDKTVRPHISLLVKLQDGRIFDGVVENLDRISDLATVRIQCKRLPVARLGSSDILKSGEWVVALGSPLALANTVTCGIVSAYRKSDEIGLQDRQMFYIQTDAAINDGNSGGPLMNLDGEAIGINSMKIMPGISFAIPIDHVRNFLAEITRRKPQKVSRNVLPNRYVGVTMLSLNEDIISALQHKRKFPDISNGVMIYKVVAGSPAEEIETPGEVHEFIADVVDHIAQAVVHIKVFDPQKATNNSVLMSGTGFIVSCDGMILTNAHVIMLKPKTMIQVILHDGRHFEANIEHADELIDLACLKISANNLPCVKFGESTKVKSGEWVIALGNPFGFTHTVTYGVISSTNRGAHEIKLYGKSMEYIQTDATINEGNSGGPLVNLDGEVIGVNVLKLVPGISFSIPIDVAKRFLEVCRKRINESIRRDITSVDRYIGIAMITLTDSILREMRNRGFKIPLHITNGLLVRKVNENSPGLRYVLEIIKVEKNYKSTLQAPLSCYFLFIREFSQNHPKQILLTRPWHSANFVDSQAYKGLKLLLV